MGSFEELDIKIDYDSDEDDILHDFFIYEKKCKICASLKVNM